MLRRVALAPYPEEAVFTVFYADAGEYAHRSRYWAQACRKYAPGLPLLVGQLPSVYQHGWEGVETLFLGDPPYPHGRQTPGHANNQWWAMGQVVAELYQRGVRRVVFVEQDVILGYPVAETLRALDEADVAWNLYRHTPRWALSELLAARLDTTRALWERECGPEPTPGERVVMLEERLGRWAGELGLRETFLVGLQHERDAPLRPGDTFLHHASEREVERFIREQRI